MSDGQSGTTPFRKPASAPASSTANDLRAWQRLTEAGPSRAKEAAATWRNGLAGFVTLLTSALVLKGSDLADISGFPKWTAVIGCLGGTVLAIAGLWRALAAEAPAEAQVSYASVISGSGSVAAYEQQQALSSQTALRGARRLVFWALVALVLGIGSWWLAPKDAAPHKAKVSWNDSSTSPATVRHTCGELIAAAPSLLAIQANSGTDATVLPIAAATEIALTSSC